MRGDINQVTSVSAPAVTGRVALVRETRGEVLSQARAEEKTGVCEPWQVGRASRKGTQLEQRASVGRIWSLCRSG